MNRKDFQREIVSTVPVSAQTHPSEGSWNMDQSDVSEMMHATRQEWIITAAVKTNFVGRAWRPPVIPSSYDPSMQMFITGSFIYWERIY